MIFSVDKNITALKAFGIKLGVTANNMANVESEEFKKSQALLQESVEGSVDVDISQVETPGPLRTKYIDDQQVEVEMSNVDLSGELP